MTQKRDIVKIISERLDLTQVLTQDVVQEVLNVITEIISEHGRIELRNFGVFETKQRKARIGRNPKTGVKVRVAAKKIVAFKPGKEMIKQVASIAKKRQKKVAK
ncbi:MAG: HU family DNA-binding protein [Thermoguttaceae bacterium]